MSYDADLLLSTKQEEELMTRRWEMYRSVVSAMIAVTSDWEVPSYMTERGYRKGLLIQSLGVVDQAIEVFNSNPKEVPHDEDH